NQNMLVPGRPNSQRAGVFSIGGPRHYIVIPGSAGEVDYSSGIQYFAYGSNLDWDQMCTRCPSARFVCAAKLKDHRIAFTHQSAKRNCGTADAIKSKGHDVWGVVYDIAAADVPALDTREGYDAAGPAEANSYKREDCQVHSYGDENYPVSVQTYFVVRPE